MFNTQGLCYLNYSHNCVKYHYKTYYVIWYMIDQNVSLLLKNISYKRIDSSFYFCISNTQISELSAYLLLEECYSKTDSKMYEYVSKPLYYSLAIIMARKSIVIYKISIEINIISITCCVY